MHFYADKDRLVKGVSRNGFFAIFALALLPFHPIIAVLLSAPFAFLAVRQYRRFDYHVILDKTHFIINHRQLPYRAISSVEFAPAVKSAIIKTSTERFVVSYLTPSATFLLIKELSKRIKRTYK